jgi:nucleotide-binding universal stress UspA family protein
MVTPTFDAILVPVATDEDARVTSRALRTHFDLDEIDVTLVYVVEKAGGAPDKASVEQREEVAENVFAATRDELPDVEVETKLVYDTDVAEGIFAAADEVGANAIVFVPRGEGGRLTRLLTGDVALSLVNETTLPVVSLPHEESDDATNEPNHEEGG